MEELKLSGRRLNFEPYSLHERLMKTWMKFLLPSQNPKSSIWRSFLIPERLFALCMIGAGSAESENGVSLFHALIFIDYYPTLLGVKFTSIYFVYICI